jgi:hypothetical protein
LIFDFINHEQTRHRADGRSPIHALRRTEFTYGFDQRAVGSYVWLLKKKSIDLFDQPFGFLDAGNIQSRVGRAESNVSGWARTCAPFECPECKRKDLAVVKQA